MAEFKKEVRINWGVDFNTNNYQRFVELNIKDHITYDEGAYVYIEFDGIKDEYFYDDSMDFWTNYYDRIYDAIQQWFYDNISELTSCEDEFILNNKNTYITDYVRYELVD